ncbi:energy transducer TonB [Salinimonas marina]|uniref:Energy transducer TonB n=1 Tax=Salinimonas marina TaxID=2785918 RepID=A0A7S9HC45_9ALTE|nr:energy transducer TonB [Salinimonas marina]QPG04729.1 energy transducer TonB [Salinimonas marina]
MKLRYSLANVLMEAEQLEPALVHYQEVVDNYRVHYGDSHIDTLYLYIDVINYLYPHVTELGKPARDLSQKVATRLVEDADELPSLAGEAKAHFYAEAAQALVRAPMLATSTHNVINFYKEADKVVSSQWDENDARTLQTRFFLGKAYELANKKQDAVQAYESIVAGFDNETEFTHPLKLITHARLVALFEKDGDSEAATKHCRAIGEMKPWDPSQQPEPIYRVNPQYPMTAVRREKEGSAYLSFIVNSQGMVEDVKVEKVDGYPGFGKNALLAVEQWRYAPQFADGQPVDSERINLQMDFKLEH